MRGGAGIGKLLLFFFNHAPVQCNEQPELRIPGRSDMEVGRSDKEATIIT